jgi:carbon storage regulator
MSLLLTRRVGESIKIGSDVSVKVMAINGGQVRIAIEAPRATRVDREEVRARIDAENRLRVAS